MSNFLQLLSPLLRKFRTSTTSLSKQTSSSSENNEDEEAELKSVTDPPTNEEQPQLSKATKGIYGLEDWQTQFNFMP